MTQFASINPTDQTILDQFESFSKIEIERSIVTAHSAFQEWNKTAIETKLLFLINLTNNLENEKEKLAQTISLEMGKPISQSIAEIDKCIFLCNYFSGNLESFISPNHIETDASESYISYTGMGVILGIMPWNFPAWQALRFCIPTLLAGNTVILKPAPNVTITAQHIEKIIAKSCPIANIYTNILAKTKDIESIIAHKYVHGVSLTGSERAGKAVAALAGQYLKKSVMELGGSDPFIVLDDADVEEAVQLAITSRLFNTGQTCISAKRFLIAQSIFTHFTEKLIEKLKLLKIGDPLSPKTNLGPLARPDLLDNVLKQISSSTKMGAVLLFGGEKIEGSGNFMTPAVVANITPKMPVFSEETFGPVFACIPFNDTEEAIGLANDSEYGLAATISGINKDTISLLCDRLEVGHIAVNGIVKSDPRLPFGGIKNSGYGNELTQFGLYEFANLKTIWKR